MRNKYKQRNSNSKTSLDDNIDNNIKYNFNSRFNLSKEKDPKIITKKNITNIYVINNYETEKQKEIYKNKIITKIKKYNPNIKLIRQSSYSRFDNDKKDSINKLSRNNKEINPDIKKLSINYIKKKKERNSSKKNYSSSNIKDFESPLNENKIINKNKDTYTLNTESTSVTKKKKFQMKPYKSNKNFNTNENYENKENINNNINNKIPLSSEGNNSDKTKVRASFKYLIHQAYKNKALSKSFSRFYKSSRSKEKDNKGKKNEENKITKMNCINKKINPKMTRNINKININKKKYLTTYTENNSSYNINNNFKEDFELIFNLLNKIKIIINKIDNYEQIHEDCNNFMQYYFNNVIYNKLANFFSDIRISYLIKKEIIFLLLCYDISFNTNSYNKTGILLKTILTIIYSNYLIILYSVLLKNYSIELDKYLIILKKEIASNNIKSEGPILQILENNFLYINNYYKMIVDNIYKESNSKIINKNIKFPYCLNNKELYGNDVIKINIISSFFNEAFKSSHDNIYSLNDLKKFFYLFLFRNNTTYNITDYEKKKEIINNSIKNVSISQFNISNNINNKNIQYLLPKIKNNYEYSLVLDLDGTLISYQKDSSNIILRPGLNSFLKNMKKNYELILFTSATHEYVDPIVKFIEKDEKYFDYILYRNHLSYDEKGEYFKNLNLLNRNIKKIIIVDDCENNFKLHKSNGICLKPFYGDSDNVLNLLSRILIKMKIDADKIGDIRICLKQVKKDLIYKNIENKYK